MALKGKERRQLRALGHHLSPVVQVGQHGITKGVVAAVNQALEDHELVKVKIGEGPEDRHDAADALAQKTRSEIAQVLGKTILLFRKRAKKSKFEKLGKDLPLPPPEPPKKLRDPLLDPDEDEDDLEDEDGDDDFESDAEDSEDKDDADEE